METIKPTESIEYHGLTINIYQDDTPGSPREYDNLGTMVYTHFRYVLGDKEMDPDEMRKLVYRSDVISLPLYLYDHSGLTMNTTGFTCPWDSGQVGFIYVTKEQLRREFSVQRVSKKLIKRTEEILRGEVATFDQYLCGDVYGYVITEPCEKCGQPEELDSCWGFYGFDYCKQEAMAVADSLIREAA
jgi:hypothetical protein